MERTDLEYVGFWLRVGASLIDTVLVAVITWPLLNWIYGSSYWLNPTMTPVKGAWDLLLSWLLPAAAIVLFWIYRQATPGKMAIAARIVDARTGAAPSRGQLVIRYLGYYVSILPLCLGLLWVAFDGRKQGWHDKIAGTVVVRSKHGGSAPVRFE